MTQLADLTWNEFETAAAAMPYGILTAGSLEQHGPHLPLNADTLVVDELARRLSAAHGAVVLGSITVGVLTAFAEWPGSVAIAADVICAQVHGYARAIRQHKNQLLILNGHDENHEPLTTAARETLSAYGTDIVIVEWAELVSDVIRQVCSSTRESHAGEGLTSVLMYWYPDVVRRERIGCGAKSEDLLMRDDLHAPARAHHVRRVSREAAPSGVIGDPREATPEKGRAITDALVNRALTIAKERAWL